MRQTRAVLGAIADGISRAAEVAAIAMLVALFTINTLEICARTLFATSFVWTYEVNLLAGSWLYFLGIVPVYRRAGDISLLGYERLLHGQARHFYRSILAIVTAGTFGLLAWFAWSLIELQLPFRTPGLRIPNPLFTAPVLIGLVGLLLVSLHRALEPAEGKSAAAPEWQI